MLRLSCLVVCAALVLAWNTVPLVAEPDQDTWIQQVVSAATNDEAELHKLAQQSGRPVWLATEALLRRVGGAAAIRFAEAHDGPDAAALRAYAREAPPQDGQSVTRAHGLRREGQRLLEVDAEASARSLRGAADTAQQIGWSVGEALPLWHLSFLLRHEDPDACTAVLERVVHLADRMGRADLLAQARARLGGIEADAGHSRRALELLIPAVEHFDSLEPSRSGIEPRCTLTMTLARVGRMGLALAAAEQAVEQARRLRWRPGIQYALSALHVCWAQAGRHQYALEVADELADLEAKGSLGLADVLLTRGLTEAATEDVESARGHIDEAIRIFHEHGDAQYESMAREARARMIHLQNGDLEAALVDAREAVRLSVEHPRERSYAQVTIALVLLRSKKAAAALETLSAASEVLGASEDMGLLSEVASIRSACLLAIGDDAAALAQATLAVDLLFAQTADLGASERAHALEVESRKRAFETAMRASLRRKAGHVVSAAERERATGTLLAVGGRRALEDTDEYEGPLGAAHSEYLEAKRRLDDLRVVGAKRRPIRTATKKLEAAGRQLDREASKLERTARLRLDVQIPRVVDLVKLKQSLAATEAFVYYVALDDRVHAVVVRQGDGDRVVDLGRLAPLVEALSLLSEPPRHDASREDIAAVADDLRALGERLIDGLGLAKDVTRVLVSPGALARAPWYALVSPDGPSMSIVMSGTTLVRARETPAPASKGILAFGGIEYAKLEGGKLVRIFGPSGQLTPLPNSRNEVEAISRKDQPPILGADATEERVRELFDSGKRWDTIHFAAHGLINAKNPSLSALALTPSKNDDGFLTTLEIYRMKVPARLVVLSACDIGEMQHLRGEGLVGFCRAFMAAGAEQVLASLWRADDAATSALMKHFHAARDAGDAPRIALRKAQELIRRTKPRWAHPYYWAGWVIWGTAD